jgi:glycosyltransferase involved in cell wall biosynthesis
MRILIEADSIASDKMSGIGHSVVEIITALDKIIQQTPHKIIIIVPFGCKKYAQKYNWLNVTIRQLPPGYRYINYVLTRTSIPVPIELLFGRGVYIFPNYKNWNVPFSKSITFVHDMAFKIFPETIHPKNLDYLNTNFHRWLMRTDGVVGISQQSVSETKHFFPEVKGKIKYIYLGVDSDVFYPHKKADVQRILDKYGISSDFFLIVGNIEPRKNVLGLLEAYKKYADATSHPAQLVIIGGDGWKNEETLNRIKAMIVDGYTVYRPNRYVTDTDLPAIYSGARALVHVAFHEGFGLPPVQAQACGCPVIASNLPVFHETLNPSGVTYIDTNKIESISNALGKAILVGPQRHSSFKKTLSWSNTVTQLLAFAGIMYSND